MNQPAYRDMTHATTYSASEARTKFADIFNEAHYGGPVVIEKHGKKVAVVSMALLERLAHLEAVIDSEHATAALKEFNAKGGKTMDEIAKELDIS